MARKPSFSTTLRTALKNAPQSRYRIAKDLGVSRTLLSRFMHGERGMTMPKLDLLCDYLGLELVSKKPKRKR